MENIGTINVSVPLENDASDAQILRDLGLPENYRPRDEAEASRLVIAWMED